MGSLKFMMRSKSISMRCGCVSLLIVGIAANFLLVDVWKNHGDGSDFLVCALTIISTDAVGKTVRCQFKCSYPSVNDGASSHQAHVCLP